MEEADDAAPVLRCATLINSTLSGLAELLFTHPNTDREWRLLWKRADLTDQAHLQLIRSEVVRVYTGTYQRGGRVFNNNPLRFFMSVECVKPTTEGPDGLTPQDEATIDAAVTDLFDENECCQVSTVRRLKSWMISKASFKCRRCRKLKIMKRAIRLWKPSIVSTERRHAANKKRHRARGGKARGLRRQVAQYVISQLRKSYEKKGGRNFMKSVSGMTRKQFQRRLEPGRSKRSGVGGSGKRTFINAQTAKLKGENRSQILDKAREFALRYDEMTLEERRVWLEKHKADVSTKKQQLVVQESAPLPMARVKTHCNMGDTMYPVSLTSFNEWRATKQPVDTTSRGGLRALASRLLPETNLVFAPLNARLPQIPRESCFERHPGFCSTEGELEVEKYNRIVQRLKTIVTQQDAGFVLYCFRAEGSDEDLDPMDVLRGRHAGEEEPHSKVLYAFLGYVLKTPALYEFIRCTALDPDDVPGQNFRVLMNRLDRPAIKVPTASSPFSMDQQSLYALAWMVAKMGPPPVKMQKCLHTVGSVLAESVVHQLEQVVPNIFEEVGLPCEEQKTGTKETAEDPLQALKAKDKTKRKRKPRKKPAPPDSKPWWMSPLPTNERPTKPKPKKKQKARETQADPTVDPGPAKAEEMEADRKSDSDSDSDISSSNASTMGNVGAEGLGPIVDDAELVTQASSAAASSGGSRKPQKPKQEPLAEEDTRLGWEIGTEIEQVGTMVDDVVAWTTAAESSVATQAKRLHKTSHPGSIPEAPPTSSELWADAATGLFWHLPGNPKPIGKITIWTMGEKASISARCEKHKGKCRRIFSAQQLTKMELGSGMHELKTWLIACHYDSSVCSLEDHTKLPKPLTGPKATESFWKTHGIESSAASSSSASAAVAPSPVAPTVPAHEGSSSTASSSSASAAVASAPAASAFHAHEGGSSVASVASAPASVESAPPT